MPTTLPMFQPHGNSSIRRLRLSRNDLTSLGPAKGYWLEMKTPATLTVGVPPVAVRRVNAPDFDGAVGYSEMSISWFGRISPTENYADVRTGYNRDDIVVNVAAFDRRLWYDESPSPTDLTAWDAVTIYLNLDGSAGQTLNASAYRFIGQLNWWRTARPWRQSTDTMALPGVCRLSLSPRSRTGGAMSPIPTEDDRGWNISSTFPSPVLASPGRQHRAPCGGWRSDLHDRDDAAGTLIADKTWPK